MDNSQFFNLYDKTSEEVLRQMNEDAKIYGVRQLDKEQMNGFLSLLNSQGLTAEQMNQKTAYMSVIRDQMKTDIECLSNLCLNLPKESEIKKMTDSVLLELPDEKNLAKNAHRKLLVEYRNERDQIKKDYVKPVIDSLDKDDEEDAHAMFNGMAEMLTEQECQEIAVCLEKKEYVNAMKAMTNKLAKTSETAIHVIGLLGEQVLNKQGENDKNFKETKEVMKKRIGDSNPLSRLLLQRTQGLLSNIYDPKTNDAFFDPTNNSITINLKDNLTDSSGDECATIFHEMGHMTDEMYAEAASKKLTSDEWTMNLKLLSINANERYNTWSLRLNDLDNNDNAVSTERKEIQSIVDMLKLIKEYGAESEPLTAENEVLLHKCFQFLGHVGGYSSLIRKNTISSGTYQAEYHDALKKDYLYFRDEYCAAVFGTDEVLVNKVMERQLFDLLVMPEITRDRKDNIAINGAINLMIDKKKIFLAQSLEERKKWLQSTHPLLKIKKKDREEKKYFGGLSDIFGSFFCKDLEKIRTNDSKNIPEKSEQVIMKLKEKMQRVFISGHVKFGNDGSIDTSYWYEDDQGRSFMRTSEAWAEMTEAESGGSKKTRDGYASYMPNSYAVFKKLRRLAVEKKI